MDYLLWKFPEQVRLRDAYGQLPLHHAVTILALTPPSPLDRCTSNGYATTTTTARMEPNNEIWVQWIQTLLRLYPDASRIRDGQGRLPLHCLLDSLPSFHPGPDDEAFTLQTNDGDDQQQECVALWVVIHRLVQFFPESLELADPVTGLVPCLQIAQSSKNNNTTSMTFMLLRANPMALLGRTNTTPTWLSNTT